MLPSFIKKITRNAEKSEPLFERLEEEGQEGEVDVHWRPPHYRGQQHGQRHPKLWNAACFVFGTLLGVTGLLVSQQATSKTSKSVDLESIKPPSAAIPQRKYSIETMRFKTDDRQYQLSRLPLNPHELFEAPSSGEADQAWGSLMPYGDGFIFVNNSQDLGIPPGIQSENSEEIRKTLFMTKLALNHTNAKEIEEKYIEPSMHHVFHCFDYIRQALMCAGDLTLEWPRTEKDGRRFAVDGWGVTHQCKSWEAISEFMAVNRKRPF